ncbi:hypothetical protein BH24ACT3_BH24ACT3_09500 [soil metagenome]
MLLAGKNVLVTGVLTDSSIAHAVACIAQEQGTDVVLTSFGWARRLTERAAKRAPGPPQARTPCDWRAVTCPKLRGLLSLGGNNPRNFAGATVSGRPAR